MTERKRLSVAAPPPNWTSSTLWTTACMRGRSAGSLAAHVAHVVAVRAVRFDGDDARAFQLAQQRRVRIADGGGVVAGRGGGARAFEQALDVGLDLSRDRGGRVLGRGGRDLDRFVLVGRALRQRLLADRVDDERDDQRRAGSRGGREPAAAPPAPTATVPDAARARWPTSSAVAPRLHARASSGQRASFLGSSAHHFTSSGVSGYFGSWQNETSRANTSLTSAGTSLRGKLSVCTGAGVALAPARAPSRRACGRRRAARRRQREHEREDRAPHAARLRPRALCSASATNRSWMSQPSLRVRRST